MKALFRIQAFGAMQRRFVSSSSRDILTPAWKPFESTHGNKLRSLAECQAVLRLREFLYNHGTSGTTTSDVKVAERYTNTLTSHQHRLALDAAMATFSLHVHARMASLVGQGFYTIGPCGEELLAASAMALMPQDSTALHYRHTAMSVARQLIHDEKSMEDILLARARGYTVSRHDPVTGGVHCSIGGGSNEYLVTSTLSSQCPPAVGRALGYSLRSQAGMPLGDDSNKPVSFVTIGDGSLHNHHFLSSFTLARHAKHLKIKCPIVFGISNNGLSISYQTKNYLDSVFGTPQDPLIPVFRANAQDMQSIYDQTQQAMDYSRQFSSPCVLLYSNIVRRFGHAATDRQAAYLDETTIQSMADTCVLQQAIQSAVEHWNVTTYPEVLDRLDAIHFEATDHAFVQAMGEPKVTLEDMRRRVSVPLLPVPTFPAPVLTQEKPQVMRKHMTRFYDDLLNDDPTVVYLGEDVRHGGYYLVTEGLAKKYPNRVLDFPPDETTLLGAALGFSQLGFIPIVEIPYAKYLDCGVDMFYEIAIQHWLTSSNTSGDGGGGDETKQKKPTLLSPSSSSSPTTTTTTTTTKGMIIRLQGFDRGVFGGNFHTHNMLSHIPPGVDVVCYSNGRDYVQGMRYSLHQAKAGRIVVVVDCTHLLNLRHIHDDTKDRQWECVYPSRGLVLEWDDIRYYTGTEHDSSSSSTGTSTCTSSTTPRSVSAIVTYGNGVVTALQARDDMIKEGVLGSTAELDIIDCPYLSGVPERLGIALERYEKVLFADICKEGPGSNVFSAMITELQRRRQLPTVWGFCGAPRTYNPLGSTVTFLNRSTISTAYKELLVR